VAAGWYVISQATTNDTQINALGSAAEVVLVWLLVPAAVLTGSSGRRVLAAVLTATALITASSFTVWTTRPQAPDGRDHRETFVEGYGAFESDVRSGLEDRGRGGTVEAYRPEPEPCIDWFGRDRGAVLTVATLRVRGWLSEDDVAHLEARLTTPDRVVAGKDYGRPTRPGGYNSRYYVTVDKRADDVPAGDPHAGPWTELELTTPCLRRS
jgi:hypothetical protein